jgi:PmbA protein
MISLTELKRFAREASTLLAREKDLAGYELYCSSAAHRVARLNFTSDIASRGLEELKSLNADGFALRIVMRRDVHETGSAVTAGDLSLAAIRDNLSRARASLIIDPHFAGLPAAPRGLENEAAVPPSGLIKTRDDLLGRCAWRILSGAIETFEKRAPLKLAHPGLIIGGDLSLIHDRVAIANSAFDAIQSDETAFFSSSVTVLIESLEAKGTATAIGSSSDDMEDAAAKLGRDAILQALALRHGERPSGGQYRIILGSQPVAEIINYVVLGSLTTGAFHAANSCYYGHFGAAVMDQRLSLVDDPQARSGTIRRRITCEGLPARRTDLIRDGKLVGLLSNYYDRNRLLTDERRGEKLGPGAPATLDFPAQSGYRLGEGGARRFDSHLGSTGTNVILHTTGGIDEKQMLASVRDGIYVGRVWYTYPINGQRAGDFTCTISGDSHVIRDGKLAAPLAPNCLRINANISQVFTRPLAVGKRPLPAIVWGAPEAYFTPALALEGITLTSVNAAPQ